ncbi:hypothetical protein [Actinoplanes derwentensis]|uniref:Dehydratase n=1 Tax=Actinoplanes derwentensis TaxID=113562 RepID=A0A1H1TQM8_9ACTN|nr:hypothetical protein [Actinoplanes derwentensis]GID85105.1 hypothetical protein Ade03nite_40290 [Actinoplanes derwentensis]SDS62454.1 hypothetical protein SAMN04489716_1211 [Actinoplanes derwentensis]
MRRTLATAVASVVASGALLGMLPSAAQAAPTICDPSSTWVTVNSTKQNLKIIESKLYSAPSTAALKITSNWSREIEFGASYTASVGGNLSIEVPVKAFNVGAGIDTTAEAAMDVRIKRTVSVTQDITIPKGHKMIQYGGVYVTATSLTKKQCSSNGATVKTVFSGYLTGPRLLASGWIDCKDTAVC